MQNAFGVTFVMKEMKSTLMADLLFVNGLFIFLVRKRTKSGTGYNIKLIGQPTNYSKNWCRHNRIIVCSISILIVMVFIYDKI
jgi:hypothetical protein